MLVLVYGFSRRMKWWIPNPDCAQENISNLPVYVRHIGSLACFCLRSWYDETQTAVISTPSFCAGLSKVVRSWKGSFKHFSGGIRPVYFRNHSAMSPKPFAQTWILMIIRRLSHLVTHIVQGLLNVFRWLGEKSGFISGLTDDRKSQDELTVFDGLTLRLFDRKLSPETLGSFIKKLDDWPRSEIKLASIDSFQHQFLFGFCRLMLRASRSQLLLR